jgi:hypothetical protein
VTILPHEIYDLKSARRLRTLNEKAKFAFVLLRQRSTIDGRGAW